MKEAPSPLQFNYGRLPGFTNLSLIHAAADSTHHPADSICADTAQFVNLEKPKPKPLLSPPPHPEGLTAQTPRPRPSSVTGDNNQTAAAQRYQPRQLDSDLVVRSSTPLTAKAGGLLSNVLTPKELRVEGGAPRGKTASFMQKQLEFLQSKISGLEKRLSHNYSLTTSLLRNASKSPARLEQQQQSQQLTGSSLGLLTTQQHQQSSTSLTGGLGGGGFEIQSARPDLLPTKPIAAWREPGAISVQGELGGVEAFFSGKKPGEESKADSLYESKLGLGRSGLEVTETTSRSAVGARGQSKENENPLRRSYSQKPAGRNRLREHRSTLSQVTRGLEKQQPPPQQQGERLGAQKTGEIKLLRSQNLGLKKRLRGKDEQLARMHKEMEDLQQAYKTSEAVRGQQKQLLEELTGQLERLQKQNEKLVKKNQELKGQVRGATPSSVPGSEADLIFASLGPQYSPERRGAKQQGRRTVVRKGGGGGGRGTGGGKKLR